MFIGFSTLAIGAALSSTLIVTAGLFLLVQAQACAM